MNLPAKQRAAIVLLFAPIAVLMIFLIMTFVVPKFKDVAACLGVPLWPLTKFVFAITPQIMLLEITLFVVLMLVAMTYIGGPGLVLWFQFRSVPVVDWVAWHVPWKQKTLQ